MILSSIHIVNYKNIAESLLHFSSGINCFVGNNGEGKTNIIDAVYYLSFCKSAFGSLDSQVVRHSQDFFSLEGHYLDREGNQEEIFCGMQAGSKKHFKRNRKEYRRLSEHIGLIPVILVSPSDISLIEGSSEERRRLMDIVISQYNHEYIDSLMRYNKALQQRNTILRRCEGNLQAAPADLLEVYEQEMASQGEQISLSRQAFIQELTPLFQHYYNEISCGKEEVGLAYTSHTQRGPLLEVIQRDRAKDIIVGYSLHGVHRDDLEMTIDGYPIRKEGSQGQNKTFVLALKLAQFELLRIKEPGKTPILLLDDIFDKLDAGRVEQIVKIVSSDDFGQIFITDTNRAHLDDILRHSPDNSEYKIFYVEKGTICSEKMQSV